MDGNNAHASIKICMKQSFWKIPKEWVTEWGLTATEALVLADIQDWPNCSHKERAKRVGLSERQLTRINDKMSASDRTKCLQKEDKMSANSKEKKENSPTPPIKNKKEKKEEQEEHALLPESLRSAQARSHTHAWNEGGHDEEKNIYPGTVKKIGELAEELREEIRNGGQFAMSAQRAYGITQEEQEEYLGWFEDKMGMEAVNVKSRGDFRRHFHSWMRIEIEKKQKKQQENGKNRQNSGVSDEFIERAMRELAETGGLAF